MRRRSIAVLLVVLLLSMGMLSACSGDSGSKGDGSASGDSGKSSGSDKTVITFLGWGTPSEVEVFETLIAQFEEMYPAIEVDYINVPDSEFDTKLQTLVAGGQQPDVFYLRPENVAKWADSGNLYDMTEYISDNEIFEEENVWAKALNMYRYDGTMPGQGAIYGLPKDIGPFALAYNKDLFAEAGVEEPDPDVPWTWSEYVENAKKLTSGDGTDKVYGSALYSLESAIWSNGADWLNDEKTEVTVDDDAFTEAMQWVADLSLVHDAAPGDAEEQALSSMQRWLEGRIGMMGIGPWSQGQFWSDCDFEWDLMPWPVSDSTGEHAIWYGGMGFGVSPASADVEASCNLAAFLAFNEDAQRTNYEMGQAIPNLVDMAEEEYMAMDKAPENKQEFINILEDENYGRRATQTFTYDSEWFDEFNSGVTAVWSGEMTAEEYCTSIKDQLQSLLDKSLEKQGNAK